MTLSVDDLVKIYNDAFWHGEKRPQDTADHAGIRAVVMALRDEMPFTNDNCGICSGNRRILNEILGGLDAGEKVAGGSGQDAAPGSIKPSNDGIDAAPATDPAPAVCEWTKRKYEPGFYATPHGIKFKDRRYDNCGICGKPIKLTEAK